MVSLIDVFLWSLVPVSELRFAIPYGVGNNLPLLDVFLVAVAGNILVCPLVYLFLNTFHKLLVRFRHYHFLFHKYVDRSRHKIEKHIGTKYEFLFLVILVAIPLPMTGAYSGSILAWFFGLKKRKAFVAITLGVIIAGVITSLASVGVSSLMSLTQ